MHLQLALGRVGGTVLVDGVDISQALTGITLKASADEPHEVTLRLAMDRVDATVEAAATVPRETRDALVALGWTPPAELEPAEPTDPAEQGAAEESTDDGEVTG